MLLEDAELMEMDEIGRGLAISFSSGGALDIDFDRTRSSSVDVSNSHWLVRDKSKSWDNPESCSGPEEMEEEAVDGELGEGGEFVDRSERDGLFLSCRAASISSESDPETGWSHSCLSIWDWVSVDLWFAFFLP